MKTPEEIKKGLEIYLTNDEIECEILCLEDERKCPYKEMSMLTGKSCGELILEDTLSLISQLEADVRIADIKREAMFAKAEQLEKERNAALECLRETLGCCVFCKYYNHTTHLCQSFPKKDRSCWEWRGVCAENLGERNTL